MCVKITAGEFETKVNAYLETDGVKSFAGLAVWLGVDTDELRATARSGGRKAGVLRHAAAWLEKELIENGLRGKYNATMTSFLLKTAFNYSEKHNDEADAPIRIELSDELKSLAK